MRDNIWQTLWTGDNGLTIQKSKKVLRGAMYRIDTPYTSEDAWTWKEARSIVLSNRYAEAGTPPEREPDMPVEAEEEPRRKVYR